MKKIIKIFNLSVITIISFIVVVGVARASGVFYYNSVLNQIVFNANVSLSGNSLSQFKIFTINSFMSPLTLGGTQDLQFRFGNTSGNSNFALNSNGVSGLSANDRVFQIGNNGTLMIGTGLTNASVASSGNVKFSIDSSGNYTTKGATTFFGGIISDGNVINSNKWNEIIKFVGNSGVITGPTGMQFSMNSSGFYYGSSSTSIAILSKLAGDFSVAGKITSPSFCLPGSNPSGGCKNQWAGDQVATAVVDTHGLATAASVDAEVTKATKPFGGMYSFYTNSGAAAATGNYVTDEALSGYSCMFGAPATGTCRCPTDYKGKIFISRYFGTESPTRDHYFVFCTKP